MKIPRLIRVLGLWLALTFALSAGAGPFTNGGGFGGGGGSVVSFPLLAPNGTVAAASYASSVDPTTGIFFLGAGTFDITVAGVERLRATAGVIDIGSQQLRFGPSVGTTDIVLARNAAGVFEINNGTAGTFRDLIARNASIQASGGGNPSATTTQLVMNVAGNNPQLIHIDSSRTINNRIHDIQFSGGQLTAGFINDVFGISTNWLTVTGGQAAGVSSIALGGHLVTGSTVPTMGACGTSPSVAGNDNALFVTVGTGGVATSCAVNFGANWTTAPVCVAQSGTDKVSYSIVSTTSLVTVTAAAAFTASSNLNILCMGR
jgi:hypothetical protein